MLLGGNSVNIPSNTRSGIAKEVFSRYSRSMLIAPRLRSGFTLIELLLVIGIIGILAAIVVIAINPSKQLSDVRSSARVSAMKELKNAMAQYIIDGNSLDTIPDGIVNAVDVCQTGIDPVDCVTNPPQGIDLSFLVPDYLVDLPIDPNETGTRLTGYRVFRSGSFLLVCSPVLEETCGS